MSALFFFSTSSLFLSRVVVRVLLYVFFFFFFFALVRRCKDSKKRVSFLFAKMMCIFTVEKMNIKNDKIFPFSFPLRENSKQSTPDKKRLTTKTLNEKNEVQKEYSF